MSAASSDHKLLLTYQEYDTFAGVTRDTAKRLAKALGLTETQMIHLAIVQLAKNILPSYELDDGPLKPNELAAIRQQVPQDRAFKTTKSLF